MEEQSANSILCQSPTKRQMNESTDETDAALVADLSDVKKAEGQFRESSEGDGVCEGPSKKRKLKQQKGGKSSGEASEARRESHKLIEQKRRQKINDKINELRELLNYPDGSQNKAVVLSAAVENIKNLKVVCGKLLASHRQLQEEYLQILSENERLRKTGEAVDTAKYAQFAQQMLEKEQKRSKQGMVSQSNFPPAMDYRLPDLNMSFLYDEPAAPQAVAPRGFQQHSVNFQPQLGRDSLGLRDGMQRDGILRDGVPMRETLPQSGGFQGLIGGGIPFGDQQVSQEAETSRQALNRLLYHHDQENTART